MNPRLRTLGHRGKITIYQVDGEKVRDSLDEEFTNFGQHYRFSFIPEWEFWIDKEAAKSEDKFYIDHLLVEWRLMRDGDSYTKALAKADKVEQAERSRSGGKEDDKGSASGIREKLIGRTRNGVSVWIVSGDTVRRRFDTDWTEGGHDKVYKFIPPKEVWIDDDVEPKERDFILLHELHERNLMALEGFKYDQAHKDSSELEHECRHTPSKLTTALRKEGWTA